MKKTILVISIILLKFTISTAQEWEWAKDFGGPSTDGGNMTCTDPSGNVFVGGYFGSASINVGSVVISNAGATGTDVFISKYDANGNALWAQRIGGTNGEFLNDICSDANGRVYVIGAFTSPSISIPPYSIVNTNTVSATQDIFVACFDAFGTIQWLKKFGGTNSDSGEGIIYSNTQSSLYITGGFSSPTMVAGTTTLTNASGSGSSSDIFLIKLNSSGIPTWAIRTGGANSSDSGVDLGLDASNQYPFVGGTFSPPSAATPTTLIGATTLTTNGNTDLFIAKYSDTGAFQWVRSAGSTSSSDGFAELTVDAGNNCYIAGNYFGATLNISSTTLTNSGSYDGFIAKYNSAGTFQWAKKIFTSGNTINDDTWSIASDASSNIYVGGSYTGTVVANGSLSFTNTVAGSTSDLYVIKFNSAGNILWGISAQGASSEGVRGMSTDALGNVYASGTHNVAGPPTFGSTTLTNYGGNDGYVAKLSCRTPTITTTSANFSVCLNSGNTFSISVNSPQSDVTYSWSAIGATGINFSPLTGTTTTISYTATSSFSIVVTGTNACSNVTTTVGTVIVNALPTLTITTIPASASICMGDPAVFTASGATTYTWNPSYILNGMPTVHFAGGVFTVTAKDANNCIGTNTVNFTVNNFPTIAVTGNSLVCLNKPNTLTANGASTYTWLPGSVVNSTLNAQPSASTVYTVNGKDINGCNGSTTFSLNLVTPQTPDICEVTVDSLSQYNNIMWDKAAYTNVDSFIVYREVSTNVYRRIGAQDKNALSLFVDTARSIGPANGDPNITSYRYKLQIRDTCGNYSAQSPWHNTVYFITNTTGTFFWNMYNIEFQGSTPVSTFELVRDNNATGTWTLVGTSAGTSTSLNDPAFSSYPNAIYRVLANGFNCNPTAKTTQQINKTKSNVKNNFNTGGILTSINVNTLNDAVSLAPNPVTSQLIISFNTTITSITKIIVTDVLGKVVYNSETQEGSSIIIPVNELSHGVYFVKVQQGKNYTVKKFIKE